MKKITTLTFALLSLVLLTVSLHDVNAAGPFELSSETTNSRVAFVPIGGMLGGGNAGQTTTSGGVIVYQTQSRRDYYDTVRPDMIANGGVQETAAHGYPQYQVNQVSPTGQRICYLYDPTAFPTEWTLGGFDSPGNNRMAAWDGTKWYTGSASSFGNKRYNYITCKTLAKADTSLTANGVSEVTINRGESVSLSWYSQYGSIRKATCTATNFTTDISVPAGTSVVTSNTCNGPFGFVNFMSFIGSTGGNGCGTILGQTVIPASNSNQPFSGTKSVSPNETTTYTYTCVNANGTESSSVTVNVVQPEVEPVGVSCVPSASSGVINEPITWTATVTGGDEPSGYEWSGSDGLSGDARSITKTYSTVGTKTARVTVSFGATTDVPTTVTPTTSTCLPGGSEVPAGYLCSAGGLETLPWGACCSGVARLQCPAPNEPAEAYCTGNQGAVGGSGTASSNGVGKWELAGSDISDLACGPAPAFRRNPANRTNVLLNMPTCSSEDPTGEPCTNVGSRCKWNDWSGASCNIVSSIFRCAATGTITPPTGPGPSEPTSITADCNGVVCSTSMCAVGPGGTGTPNPPGNPNTTPDNPQAPTWGVTINLPGQCSVGPMCVGASVHQQALDCSKEFVKACPFGCYAGECLAPQPEIDLSIAPAGVRRGESCTVRVSARHVRECSISGTGVSQTLTPNAAGVVTEQSFVTPGMSNTSTYTVSCTSERGTVSKSAQCVLLPNFREI